MQELSQLIPADTTVPTGLNTVDTTGTADTADSSKQYDNDYLYEDMKSKNLVNDSFKGWYMKAFYKLGKAEVHRLAALAKADGKQPARYFSYLLKKAVKDA